MTGERILIVDDGRENREFIVDYILVPNGYTALTAADGEEGLRMVFEESPDLVLLDLQMPKLTGVQVLEAMRAKQINIPVILMTFYGSEEVAIQVFRLGVRDYIAKPFTVDEMLDAIERALTETRLRREKEALTERVLSANRMLQRRLQELNTLYSIGKSVTALLDIDKLLLRICEAAAYVTSAEECSVMMLRGGQLMYTARKVRNEAYAEPIDEPVKDNLALQVIKTAKPVVLTPAESSYAPNAVLYMPLKVRDRVIGVLGVEHVGEQRSFRDHDVTLLGTLADYAAIAIENANNFRELRQMKDQMGGEEIAPAAASEASPSRHKAGLLIAGIRGYDELMGKLPPEEAVETLGEYLSLAEGILVKHGAYLGELSHGIVAAFDLPNRDAIQNIIESTIALQRAIYQRNRKDPDGRSPKLYFSVGLSIGDVLTGSVGGKNSIVGDVVDLAQRLQEMAESGQIVLDESFAKLLGKRAKLGPLGEHKFRGRRQPVRVYEFKGLA